jgi:integrase
VFDSQDRLDLPLTSFIKPVPRRLSPRSVRVYVHALMSFLAFVERRGAAPNKQLGWNTTPDRVRALAAQYLEEELGCVIRQHRLGFELVSVTAKSPSNVGVFLASVRLFFNVMREVGCYAGENPFVDVGARVPSDSDADAARPPLMPDVSGVEPPRSRKRDSLFKLVGRDWTPQIIDDPVFPVAILTGGRKLHGWGLREECVTKLLFETGGRIFEVAGLTLGDWRNRGLTREATAASKGSHGKRVKFFRFSSETVTLMRRYFDGERRSHDCRRWTLAEYLRACDDKSVNPHEVPLLMSARGTQLSATSYRETYWIPACRQAGLDADPHQARHWYVTMAVRTIHETSIDEGEIRGRIRELIEYMQWRGGEQTMASYGHYFDAARHADIQDQLHERLRVALEQGLKQHSSRAVAPLAKPAEVQMVDPDMAFLRVLGGGHA